MTRVLSGTALRRLEVLALVAIGGFAGANLRYFVGLFAEGASGTLLVNVLGSFVLGSVLYEAIHSGVLADETRAVVGTGFLSSFTTYSTFALQTVQLDPLWMLGNVLASYALGFGGVLAGRWLALRLDDRGDGAGGSRASGSTTGGGDR